MIDRRILRLTPKRFFCPLCGDWHDWEGKTLQSYDEDNPYEYECGGGVELKFWCDEDCIYIRSSDLCDKINTYIDDEVYFEDIECDAKEPVIKFSTCISTDEIVCSGECDYCDYCDECNLPSIGDKRCNDDDEFELELEFNFEFSSRYFDKYAQSDREEFLKQEREAERERQEVIRQQEETKRQQEEAKLQKPIVTESQTKSQKGKEDTTMANNFFNMNMEFGPNKDENIASTLMGVAVKNGDSWRIYDKKKKEITDVGDMQLGNLPIFILPTTQLSEGDLIKDAGEYYFVIKVQSGSTQTLCAKTGEMK